MIKFESIVFNKENQQQKEIFSFVLVEEKINFIYCKKKNYLENFISIGLGYLQPYLGNLIYEDIDYLKLNLNQKHQFAQDNISYVYDFYDYQKDFTVKEYIQHILVCQNFNIKKSNNLIFDLVLKYDLDNFLDEKIINLNNLEKVKLLLLSGNIKCFKYVYFLNINYYFENNEIKSYFFNCLKKTYDKNCLIILLSNINNLNKIEDINFINLDQKNENKTFYLRNNKNFIGKKNTNIKFNNLLFLFKFIFQKNIINYLLTWIVFLLAFIWVNQTFYNTFETQFNQWNFRILVFQRVSAFLILLFISIMDNIYYTKKSFPILYTTTRKGISIRIYLRMQTFLMSLKLLLPFLISTIIQAIIVLTTKNNFDWLIPIGTSVLIICFHLLFFIVYSLYCNKNIFKFNDDLV